MNVGSPPLEDFVVEEEDLIIKLNTLLLKVDETVNQNKILELSKKLLQENYDALVKMPVNQGNGQPDDLQKVLFTFQEKFREFQIKNNENDKEKDKLILDREMAVKEKNDAVQQLNNYTNKTPITISQKNQSNLIQKIAAVKNIAADLNKLIIKNLGSVS